MKHFISNRLAKGGNCNATSRAISYFRKQNKYNNIVAILVQPLERAGNPVDFLAHAAH